MADALDEARGVIARVRETEAAAAAVLCADDPDAVPVYQALRDRNAARMALENECERLLAALCDELALLREYHEASEVAAGHKASTEALLAQHHASEDCAERERLRGEIEASATASGTAIVRIERARTALAAWKAGR